MRKGIRESGPRKAYSEVGPRKEIKESPRRGWECVVRGWEGFREE